MSAPPPLEKNTTRHTNNDSTYNFEGLFFPFSSAGNDFGGNFELSDDVFLRCFSTVAGAEEWGAPFYKSEEWEVIEMTNKKL